MLDDEAQAVLDEAIESGDATYEIVHGRRALVLKVRNGNHLIHIMDELFGFAELDFNSNAHRSARNAVPALTIGKYVVTPKYEHKEGEKYHEYELSYSEKNGA